MKSCAAGAKISLETAPLSPWVRGDLYRDRRGLSLLRERDSGPEARSRLRARDSHAAQAVAPAATENSYVKSESAI
jgi:hypothetical protein